ncbi:succinate-semialdehyde dehydrogenase [Variovorax paradoxus]|jgi:succinate-semialdehyde dehydrogenase/glutarate-semialdehyde dehydrogenase|uniref:NAD-dependent succinate-semialdehyde dehydrogenase n=1 Tax=Variovorax TaxID=34072 RepID=UPI0006E5BF6D|nr:NAD-dependent succinate-semialdehyde dehydrogenase [Variovorax sp. CY25R-8]KPU91300.1 succinate-semialdehyde dehydrogenase [Variovorax paradoxus]KPV03313.1 succinate-semialdehyde dehydrogenase [Variovorax paradoxus]KPV04622.1 succinate-semialdehyde dehydrogenase [Variovorax paradoxus]KPV07665.1 succinate-semialdehyde dehydrogenase [Variovorax paradoxus]KPV16862.1 succinate-semialdehyde dehydrogenase [Variovorax paradoxus]
MPALRLKDPTLLRQQAYVAGAWIDADDGTTVAVTNPANGETIGTVPMCGTAETERAIAAAEKAQKGWARLPAKERSAILRKLNDLMLANVDDLALIMTTEQGKPLAESRGEIAYAASFIEWFAEEARRVYGDTIPAPQADRRILALKQPVGVTAAITPWNFPAAMLTRKAGPALAAGCAMVVKPATQTPYSALAFAELAERAGVPKGLLSVLTGSASKIGGEMTRSPIVRKLTFTGSTEVGRTLMKQSADTIKKLSLELGGNAPFIVFDDADIDAAVEGAMVSKYRNTGQTCVCANRLYVQRGVLEAFTQKLVARVQALKVGDGTEAGVNQGPLIDAKAVEKIEEHVADAVAKGAQVLAGGKRHALGGLFYEPTVIGGATADMLFAREETFGPLAPIFAFDTEEEAVAAANDTEFGLAAYFYSRDIGRIMRVAESLESGIVGVNTGLVSTAEAPFGGVKQSGLGREGSKYGLDDFLEVKYVCLAGLDK